MQIIITDNKVETISVSIETPYELRALYLLVKLVEQPAFRNVRNGIESFDDIPGLGALCKRDIYQNPIKRIYELMVGTNGKKPTPRQVCAIVKACKNAINTYNKKLDRFFNCEGLRDDAELRLPYTILIKAANSVQPLSKEKFMHDRSVRHSYRDKDAREALYAEYVRHQSLILSFRAIDPTHTANIAALLETFKALSQAINGDTYLQNHIERINGIVTPWGKTYIKPALIATLFGIGVATAILALKSAYDEVLEDALEGDSPLWHHAVNNSVSTASSITTLLVSRHVYTTCSRREAAAKNTAVEQLGAAIPEYQALLVEKGFPFKANEITHTTSHPQEQEMAGTVPSAQSAV